MDLSSGEKTGSRGRNQPPWADETAQLAEPLGFCFFAFVLDTASALVVFAGLIVCLGVCLGLGVDLAAGVAAMAASRAAPASVFFCVFAFLRCASAPSRFRFSCAVLSAMVGSAPGRIWAVVS